MKAFLFTLIIIFIGVFVIYSVPSYRQSFITFLSYSACDTPLAYKLGYVDTRFGLSKSEVLSDINEATSIWDNAENKTLFTYSPSAFLTVNFVFDERQALTNSINKLNTNLGQNSSTLRQQINDYESQVEAYKQQLNSFNKTVQAYNNQGGAPAEVYQKLRQEQDQLKLDGDKLNARARQLNLSTVNYNAQVNTLNQEVNQFNADIAQKPEEGLYNSGNNTITIYFSNTHPELIHTLAHEFGHALGMVHAGGPAAIMFPYTTSYLQVSSEDRKQLNYVCRQQSLPLHWITQFENWLYAVIHRKYSLSF